jgi:hypothetical protein
MTLQPYTSTSGKHITLTKREGREHVYPSGDKLILSEEFGTFAKVGVLEYIQVAYLEKTIGYFDSNPNEVCYFTSATQYFPTNRREEAVVLFHARLDSSEPYRAYLNLKSYTLDEIKAYREQLRHACQSSKQ